MRNNNNDNADRKYNFNPNAALHLFWAMCVGIDLGITPFVTMRCWNAFMPTTFDNVKEIDYTRAFMLRILIMSLQNIAGGVFSQLYLEKQYNFYVNSICGLLEKNVR